MKLNKIYDSIVWTEERESSFRYDLAEDLGVSSEVISTILSLEHAKSLRKRYELLRELKETKDRVFHALLLASDKVGFFTIIKNNLFLFLSHRLNKLAYQLNAFKLQTNTNYSQYFVKFIKLGGFFGGSKGSIESWLRATALYSYLITQSRMSPESHAIKI